MLASQVVDCLWTASGEKKRKGRAHNFDNHLFTENQIVVEIKNKKFPSTSLLL